MRWSLNKVRARIILGYWFVVTALGRLRFWERRQVRQNLLERYRPDGLSAMRDTERAVFASFQKCVNCSLCTLSCEGIREGRGAPSFEPKFLLLAYGRGPRSGDVFRDDWIPCAACNACTVECPNDVPIHTVADTIRNQRSAR